MLMDEVVPIYICIKNGDTVSAPSKCSELN